ncbi:MAG: M20/M25/M40 family metallo-hydrolase [Planctomycetes bacterium]|nr:M20/M25/M40 family metallo-hydrolase [Planctomycetota bacterium]
MAKSSTTRGPAETLSQPRMADAVDMVMELMAIPGRSGEEGQVADFVRRRLIAAGAPPACLRTDTAQLRTPVRGETGNLILKLPGTLRGSRRMLSAHLDTVPICLGARPRRQGGLVRSADPETGLGADDRAGVAVLLCTAEQILRRQLAHPPLTFCWFVQEETGLHGSRCVNRGLLGRPKMAFNWDGGSPSKLTVGATGGYRMSVEIHGIASHAGGAPEWGVSAITIASLAISDLYRRGWLGDVRRGKRRGTSNVGVIQGGDATNVVTDRVVVKAEARSHDREFRQQIIDAMQSAFDQAATRVQNVAGSRGSVQIEGRLDYESFRLPEDHPCVLAAARAVRNVGLQPETAISNGGLDANWLVQHGIPTVSLGCGQLNQHMKSEALDIAGFRDACRIALQIATSAETETESSAP